MRKDVAFVSKGLRCSGWLYVPDNLTPGQKAPTIVRGTGSPLLRIQHYQFSPSGLPRPALSRWCLIIAISERAMESHGANVPS